MKLKNKLRLILQLVILALVIMTVIRATDVEAFCPLGGFLSIGSRFVHGASSCQMSATQMFLGVALVIGVLVIGKLFCSHICPVGTVTEWLGRWGRKFKIQVQRIPDWLDRGLRSLKYLLLLPVLYYTATSSELFCKTFDPYYAATTGFGADVIWWWALPALVITMVGSLVLRQFWCKYLCPLGALSNLFQFGVFAILSLGIYIMLQVAGITFSIFWLFLVWIAGGFLLEVLNRQAGFLPFIRIRREATTCIDCGLCDKVCPYDIAVSKADVVNHADCTICVDCVAVCPVKNCLTLKRANWKQLPVFATVALVAISLGFSSRYEISTLSERWGDQTVPTHLSHYETIVKSVKCYGTANGLKRKIDRTRGIYGMDAYAASHRVVLYYNPEEIDQSGIRKAIFSPYKSKVQNFKDPAPQKLAVMYLGVENLLDNVDNLNFLRILSQSGAIYGFESDYGEPVRVIVYYDAQQVTAEEIIQLIETRKLEYKDPQGAITELMLEFDVQTGPDILGEVNSDIFQQHIFNPFNRKFGDFNKTPPDSIRILEMAIPGLQNPQVRRYLPYLASHISQNDGILGLETFYTDQPVTWVYYHSAQADTGSIMNLIRAPQMRVTFSNGEVRDFDNPFKARSPYSLKTMDDIASVKKNLQEKLAFLKIFQTPDIEEE